MKKIALFRTGEIEKNCGGPSGYLYNLKSGLADIHSEIKIITYVKTTGKNHKEDRSISKDRDFHFFYIFIQELFSCISVLFYHKKNGKAIYNLLKDYDIVHVHSVENAYSLSKIKKLKCQIILTPHKPEPAYQEVVNNMKDKWKTQYPFPFLKFVYAYIETKSYQAVSGFLFPCKGAMDIYKGFPGFLKGSKNKWTKFVFTGVFDKKRFYEKGKYRQRFGLSFKDKVVVYIGRHSVIKGYDMLILNAKFFEENQIHMICAGKYDEKLVPDSKTWHECGYIQDAYNLLGDADVVVVPNRNTYFDLVIIEALSMGKLVLSTNTGGNIDIHNLTDGLLLFEKENQKDFREKLLYVLYMDEGKKIRMEQSSRKFYEKYCTIGKFAARYEYVMESIWDEEVE